jgi:ribosomal protein L11 methyltransferase
MSENPSKPAETASRFHCIVARAPDLAVAERVLAEAMAAGASGAEQRESERGVTLLLYAPDARREAVVRAATDAVGRERVEVSAVVKRDWSEVWKAGLRAIEVSPRLRVRPSFDTSPARPEQRDLVIDPGQAFGTGGHESTRLALAWIDALRGELAGGHGVLDVGTGTGVLALAALALGADRATAFDLDPLAAPAARGNATRNALDAHLSLFTGPIEALAPSVAFRGIVANMLRRELEPVLAAMVDRLDAGGWLVISGLLDDEVARWTRRADAAGLELESMRRACDASGTVWAGLLMRRRAAA